VKDGRRDGETIRGPAFARTTCLAVSCGDRIPAFARDRCRTIGRHHYFDLALEVGPSEDWVAGRAGPFYALLYGSGGLGKKGCGCAYGGASKVEAK